MSLDKLRKLKAHADSAAKIGNHAEAAAFYSKLHTLMEKGGYTLADLTPAPAYRPAPSYTAPSPRPAYTAPPEPTPKSTSTAGFWLFIFVLFAHGLRTVACPDTETPKQAQTQPVGNGTHQGTVTQVPPTHTWSPESVSKRLSHPTPAPSPKPRARKQVAQSTQREAQQRKAQRELEEYEKELRAEAAAKREAEQRVAQERADEAAHGKAVNSLLRGCAALTGCFSFAFVHDGYYYLVLARTPDRTKAEAAFREWIAGRGTGVILSAWKGAA